MVKRANSLIVVALLVLFGPAPMALCAALADLPADCKPAPHCEAMGQSMGNDPVDATLTATTGDCCTVSSAPLPERQSNAPVPVISLAPAVAPEMVVPAFEADAPSVTPRARSAPPDLQSALCVFLI